MAGSARRRPHRTVAIGFQDWAARMADILEMRQLGSMLAEIGWKYGVSAGDVKAAMREHDAPADLIDPPKPILTDRVCLCYQGPFKAKTRFLRLCDDCRGTH